MPPSPSDPTKPKDRSRSNSVDWSHAIFYSLLKRSSNKQISSTAEFNLWILFKQAYNTRCVYIYIYTFFHLWMWIFLPSALKYWTLDRHSEVIFPMFIAQINGAIMPSLYRVKSFSALSRGCWQLAHFGWASKWWQKMRTELAFCQEIQHCIHHYTLWPETISVIQTPRLIIEDILHILLNFQTS